MKTDKKTVNQYANDTHPDYDEVVKYVHGTLPMVEMEDIKEHVQGCMACWMTVQAEAGAIAKKHLEVVR